MKLGEVTPLAWAEARPGAAVTRKETLQLLMGVMRQLRQELGLVQSNGPESPDDVVVVSLPAPNGGAVDVTWPRWLADELAALVQAKDYEGWARRLAEVWAWNQPGDDGFVLGNVTGRLLVDPAPPVPSAEPPRSGLLIVTEDDGA